MKLVVAMVVLLVACKDKSSGPVETQEERQAKAIAKLEADLLDPKRRGPGFSIKPEPVPAAEAKPGPAYMVLNNVGLAKLDGGALTVIKAELPLVEELVIGKQGELYVVGNDDVWKLDGDKLTRLGEKGEPMFNKAAAVAPDGSLWIVATLGAVHHWNGTAWKKYDAVFPDKESPVSIAVDAKGRVWAGGKQMVVVFDGTAWKTVWDIREVFSQSGFDPPTYFDVLFTPKGELLAFSATGYALLDGTNMKYVGRKVGQDNLVGNAALLGNELVVMGWDKLFRVQLDTGAEKMIEEPKDAPWGSNGVLDAQGRMWTSPTDGGFTVVAPDGTSTHFAAGSLPGLTSSVHRLGVVGAGPALPAAAGEIAKGSIRGVVTNAGKPVAKAPVEVCSRPRSEFKKDATPCTDDRTKATAITDETGAFQIDNLPLLDYGIAVQVDTQWYGLRGKACAGLEAGAVCDVGALDVTNKPIF
jgi:hypothetical protein